MATEIKHRLLVHAYKIIGVQAMFVVFITFFIQFSLDFQAMYSAFLGGMVCVLANACFAMRMFAETGAQAKQEVVSAFYRAELRKILVTAALFFICIKCVSLSYGPFFFTYVGAHMMFWVASFLISVKPTDNADQSVDTQLEHGI